MSKETGTIFNDKQKLLEMLSLRSSGYSFNFLSELYNCDRTSLRYQCRKYQIFPLKNKTIKNDKSPEIFNPIRIWSSVLIQVAPFKVSHWKIIDGEKVNTGKSYADYLANLSPYNKETVKSNI